MNVHEESQIEWMFGELEKVHYMLHWGYSVNEYGMPKHIGTLYVCVLDNVRFNHIVSAWPEKCPDEKITVLDRRDGTEPICISPSEVREMAYREYRGKAINIFSEMIQNMSSHERIDLISICGMRS